MSPSQRQSLLGLASCCCCLLLGACQYFAGDQDETPLLARVGDRALHESAVGRLIPAGTNPEDSVALLRDYVQRWAREATLSNEAAASVGENADIERLVEDYRLGLQRQRFEEDVLSKAIDTTIAAEDFEALYAELSQSANAPHQLVRALVVKLPDDHPQLKELQQAWNASTEETVTVELRQLGEDVATLALLDPSRYFEAPELRLLLPGIEGDIPVGSRVIRDGGQRYFVRVFESVPRGQRAPLGYLEPRLRKLILEERRGAYLETYINKIYREAQARNEVNIYVGNAQ